VDGLARRPRVAGQRTIVHRHSRAGFVVLLLFLLAPALAVAQTLVLVRHAERETGQGDDGLSAEGRERARRLGAMLRDLKLTHVFTSDRRRTLETAGPAARAAHLTPAVIAMPDAAGSGADPAERQVEQTTAAVKTLPPSARVLIVGHSNTVPMMLKALGVNDSVTIADTEFDNLFLVMLSSAGPPGFVRLRY
jgi:broad specificity phosphatase PhoE